MSFKQICEEKGIDINKAFDMVVGEGGNLLPTKTAFQSYFAEITETSVICSSNKLGVKLEIPFAWFEDAEFGIGSGQLWLQCVVNGSPFVFTTRRKNWKGEGAKLLLAKIGEHTEIKGIKEYRGYTGKMFLFYLFK